MLSLQLRENRHFSNLRELLREFFQSRPRQVGIGMNMIEKVFSEAQEKWSEYLKTVTLEDVAKEVAHD